jgi:hypothetical protein
MLVLEVSVIEFWLVSCPKIGPPVEAKSEVFLTRPTGLRGLPDHALKLSATQISIFDTGGSPP